MNYWEYARCKYTILELKYSSFWKNQNFGWKSIFEYFFRTLKSKKSIFWGFQKKSRFRRKIMFFGKIRKMRDSLVLRSILKTKMIIYVYPRKMMHTECPYFNYSGRNNFWHFDCRGGPTAGRRVWVGIIFKCGISKNSTKNVRVFKKKSVFAKRCRIEFCS